MAVKWTINLGCVLGLQFHDSKTVWPCMQLVFLSIELDSVAMEARLSVEKLKFLSSTLQIWQVKSICFLKELQKLVGFLQFCSQVIPRSRTFIHHLIDFSMKFSSPFQ
ncbi:hypothetical protein BDQ17DRAFT_1436367 [Cyathus striatus]|nr:hypothetical protein BDQ17DRAFT_1436367 [Cyathus striatus]